MARPDRLLRTHTRERYLLTLDSGESFDGVLMDSDDRHVVLADAETVAGNGDRLHVDGEVWIPRDRLLYMQRPVVAR